jgi:hypothetical protein
MDSRKAEYGSGLKLNASVIFLPMAALVMLLLGLFLFGYGCKLGIDPGNMGECEECTETSDCKSGLTCELFTVSGKGTLARRCATANTKTCK